MSLSILSKFLKTSKDLQFYEIRCPFVTFPRLIVPSFSFQNILKFEHAFYLLRFKN